MRNWYRSALHVGVFLSLALVTLATPFAGALGLAKIFAWAFYLSVFVVPSPCRAGAAYPFRHGFRSSGCAAEAPDQREEGATSA